MKKILILCMSLLSFVGCSNEKANSPVQSSGNVIISIPAIASKKLNEVENVLGKAQKCEKSKYGQQCVFSNGDVEITFINEKADWITINSLKDKQFDESSLGLLGLPKSKIDFKNYEVVRWNNIPNYSQVEFYLDGQGKIFYGYIKVNTK